MVVYCVSVLVKEGHEEDFIKATRENREGTRKEPGNIRFDILQEEDDKSKFLLLEVYKSDDAVKEHKNTEHYQKWRETVSPWMAKPREGIKYFPVEPEDIGEW